MFFQRIFINLPATGDGGEPASGTSSLNRGERSTITDQGQRKQRLVKISRSPFIDMSDARYLLDLLNELSNDFSSLKIEYIDKHHPHRFFLQNCFKQSENLALVCNNIAAAIQSRSNESDVNKSVESATEMKVNDIVKLINNFYKFNNEVNDILGNNKEQFKKVEVLAAFNDRIYNEFTRMPKNLRQDESGRWIVLKTFVAGTWISRSLENKGTFENIGQGIDEYIDEHKDAHSRFIEAVQHRKSKINAKADNAIKSIESARLKAKTSLNGSSARTKDGLNNMFRSINNNAQDLRAKTKKVRTGMQGKIELFGKKINYQKDAMNKGIEGFGLKVDKAIVNKRNAMEQKRSEMRDNIGSFGAKIDDRINRTGQKIKHKLVKEVYNISPKAFDREADKKKLKGEGSRLTRSSYMPDLQRSSLTNLHSPDHNDLPRDRVSSFISIDSSDDEHALQSSSSPDDSGFSSDESISPDRGSSYSTTEKQSGATKTSPRSCLWSKILPPVPKARSLGKSSRER